VKSTKFARYTLLYQNNESTDSVARVNASR